MLGSQNFNELHKSAYSHGLESIYSIENIDLRTLRRLQDNPLDSSPVSKKSFKLVCEQEQYQLDFGACFRNWIPPFFPLESIRVLGLSKYAEKALKDLGKLRVGDLLDSQQLKGLGQGHLVEITEKVAAFVAHRNPTHAETIDFAGWIRALFADLECKQIYPLLEKYQLQDLVAITPAESVELKRLNLEQRGERCQEALAKMDQKLLEEGRKSITFAFLIPWMTDREGIAAQGEIEERLERMSDEGEVALKVLNFLNGSFDPFFFGKYLTPLTANLYAINSAYATHGHTLLKLAATYFYSPKVFYPFKTLVQLLHRELATHWISLPPRFVEKILFAAPAFRLSKNHKGELQVYYRKIR